MKKISEYSLFLSLILPLTGCFEALDKSKDAIVVAGNQNQAFTGQSGFQFFQSSVWPEQRTSCGSCHNASHASPIGSLDAAQAYFASFDRLNPTDITSGILWIRSGNLHCGSAECGPSTQSGFTPLYEQWAALELGATGDTPPPPPPPPPPVEPSTPPRGARNYRDLLNTFSRAMPGVVVTSLESGAPAVAVQGSLASAFNSLSAVMPHFGKIEELNANAMMATLNFLGRMCSSWARISNRDSSFGFTDTQIVNDVVVAGVPTRRQLSSRYIERFLGRAATNAETTEMGAAYTEYLANSGACGADVACKAIEIRKIGCFLAGGGFESLTL